MKYPDGPPPDLPAEFAGRPSLEESRCAPGCDKCAEVCPTAAIAANGGLRLDTGRCIFCRVCEKQCPSKAIVFTKDFQMAAGKRNDLLFHSGSKRKPDMAVRKLPPAFKRSLRLRQVSAGGCNACEADTNVLSTVAWDLGRFGVQFVASPRHADGLLITGPVTKNMRLALIKTYEAVPSPKIVIAVGSCAIAGGPYIGHPEAHDGASGIIPVDLFIPGCPPHPLVILDGILRLLAAIGETTSKA